MFQNQNAYRLHCTGLLAGLDPVKGLRTKALEALGLTIVILQDTTFESPKLWLHEAHQLLLGFTAQIKDLSDRDQK